ncbi:MAG: hypothetical protein GY756_11090, partial [bacterium]|nr:hypothetical protein [bacterium]
YPVIVFSEDLKYICVYLTASFDPCTEDYTIPTYLQEIHIYELASGKKAHSLKVNSNQIGAISISPDSKYIASGILGGDVLLWNLATGDFIGDFPLFTWISDPVMITTVPSILFSQDSKYIIYGSKNNIIKAYKLRDKQLYFKLGIYHKIYNINAIAFSSDYRLLASASNDDFLIKLWDINQEKEIMTFRGHNSYIKELIFADDNKFIISIDSYNNIIIWDIKNPVNHCIIKPLKDNQKYYSAAISKNCLSISKGNEIFLTKIR